ncbi:MAG: Na+/H+ antiporter subunit E [Gammaproteobacteria bacterium]|jgi:multicomponent Na+:H+ antiporter subunit E|nr:Na+/H+ antiporter subunit E [Xanthomonadales bacterium]
MKKESVPYISVFLICMVLWLMLTATFATDELVSGFVIAVVVSVITAPRMQILNGLRLHLGVFPGVVAYLFYFLYALLKANLDLAKRVLSRNMHIHPQMVEIKTSMQSDLGKLFLANSITLTPGTLTVDVSDDKLLVHWIDCPEGVDMEKITGEIIGQFEKYLKRFVK